MSRLPSLQTRDKLRSEALRLFSERGTDAVSVRDIAAAVGMSAPNLYAHYSGKDALIADLFDSGYRRYGDLMREAADAVADPLEKLALVIRCLCRLHDEDRALFRFLLLTQHRHLGSIPSEAPDNPVALVQELVSDILGAGRSEVVLMTAAVTGLVVQAATFSLYGRLPHDLLPLADGLVAASRKLLT